MRATREEKKTVSAPLALVAVGLFVATVWLWGDLISTVITW